VENPAENYLSGARFWEEIAQKSDLHLCGASAGFAGVASAWTEEEWKAIEKGGA
jgi:hypothetical protein